ncbi:hypothetical protein V6N12_073101 [Hibiscus sabdariffa]|uniref:Uncharacterized protein n=1 Tax=Hibiscus sabdariffa TaxID=183260 RepID=A0ABR2AFI1_9ROSI
MGRFAPQPPNLLATSCSKGLCYRNTQRNLPAFFRSFPRLSFSLILCKVAIASGDSRRSEPGGDTFLARFVLLRCSSKPGGGDRLLPLKLTRWSLKSGGEILLPLIAVARLAPETKRRRIDSPPLSRGSSLAPETRRRRVRDFPPLSRGNPVGLQNQVEEINSSP